MERKSRRQEEKVIKKGPLSSGGVVKLLQAIKLAKEGRRKSLQRHRTYVIYEVGRKKDVGVDI